MRGLLRSLGAEPLAQEFEIADLPSRKLVAGVAAELHLDAEAADRAAGDPAFAREIPDAERHAGTHVPAVVGESWASLRSEANRVKVDLAPCRAAQLRPQAVSCNGAFAFQRHTATTRPRTSRSKRSPSSSAATSRS